jgi:hypothetical protein
MSLAADAIPIAALVALVRPADGPRAGQRALGLCYAPPNN